MTTEFVTGEFVTFSNAKDGSFVVSFTNKHADLKRGQAESAEIIVGEYPPLPALLTNYDANTAGMTFDNPGPIYQRLRIGTRIAVNPATGESMVYPLSQVNRGLQRLLACTMREMGFANYGNQAVGDPFGAGIPVRSRIVGVRSTSSTGSAIVVPRGSFAGQRTMNGTCTASS